MHEALEQRDLETDHGKDPTHEALEQRDLETDRGKDPTHEVPEQRVKYCVNPTTAALVLPLLALPTGNGP